MIANIYAVWTDAGETLAFATEDKDVAELMAEHLRQSCNATVSVHTHEVSSVAQSAAQEGEQT